MLDEISAALDETSAVLEETSAMLDETSAAPDGLLGSRKHFASMNPTCHGIQKPPDTMLRHLYWYQEEV